MGELLKYGGGGMVDLLYQLFKVVWHEETIRKQWRDGLIVNLFKKEDKEDPGNYRGITLLSVVVKVFCKVKVYKTFSKNVEGCRDGHAKNYRN